MNLKIQAPLECIFVQGANFATKPRERYSRARAVLRILFIRNIESKLCSKQRECSIRASKSVFTSDAGTFFSSDIKEWFYNEISRTVSASAIVKAMGSLEYAKEELPEGILIGLFLLY